MTLFQIMLLHNEHIQITWTRKALKHDSIFMGLFNYLYIFVPPIIVLYIYCPNQLFAVHSLFNSVYKRNSNLWVEIKCEQLQATNSC